MIHGRAEVVKNINNAAELYERENMAVNPMFFGEFEEAYNLFEDKNVVREYKEHFVSFLGILDLYENKKKILIK